MTRGKARIKTPETLRELAATVARACRLIEGPQGVLNVLDALMNSDRLPTKELAKLAKLPLPVTAAIKKELQKRGIISTDGPATLSASGRSLLEESLGISSYHPTICPTCLGKRHRQPPGFPELTNKISNYLRNRPRVDVKLDQSQAEPETSMLRAAYMVAQGGILGRRVLFLGDDDLVSIVTLIWVRESIGLKALSKIDVTVVDTDTRYLDFIKDICAKENLNISLMEHDLRDPLPEGTGLFDTFATDPPYTAPGGSLFVSRGLECLVKDGTGKGFLCFGESRPDILGEVERRMSEMGLVMLEVIPGFNRYVGCSILANSSTLFHLSAPLSAHPLIRGRYDGKLYTNEFRGHPKRYTCVKCKESVLISSGMRYETIEELKDEGCPFCNGKKFKAYG